MCILNIIIIIFLVLFLNARSTFQIDKYHLAWSNAVSGSNWATFLKIGFCHLCFGLLLAICVKIEGNAGNSESVTHKTRPYYCRHFSCIFLGIGWTPIWCCTISLLTWSRENLMTNKACTFPSIHMLHKECSMNLVAARSQHPIKLLGIPLFYIPSILDRLHVSLTE